MMAALNFVRGAFLSLALLGWSFANPAVASWVYVGICGAVWLYILVLDGNRPSPDPGIWNDAERTVIREYHLFFKFPSVMLEVSRFLTGIGLMNWVWVPWLYYKRQWPQAAIMLVYGFATMKLTERLAPTMYLARRARDGQMRSKFNHSVFVKVLAKMREDQ